MARAKAAIRRFTVVVRSDFRRRTIKPFKVKETLPEQKSPNIKKNEQIIKTINVRRKSRYFSGRNKLIF